MKKILSSIIFTLTFTLTLSSILNSQSEVYYPFEGSEDQNRRSDLGINGDYKFLDLSLTFNQEVLSKRSKDLQISIPLINGKNINITLIEFNIFSQDFLLRDSKGQELKSVHLGKFFHGTAYGYPQSTIVLNVFKDEVSATIDLGDRTFSITKIKEENQYILYEERDLRQQPELACFAENLKGNVRDQLVQSSERMAPNPDNCVKMYIELDHDLYNVFGDVTDTYNYFAGAFSQVVTLYSNENINMILNEVKVWDEADPYTGIADGEGPSSDTYLNQFKSALLSTNWNGDLAHLVGINGGGGVAYVNALCNPTNAFGYSGINSSYSIVPAYSWTVNVLTHELGHNLGSPHTHSCSWNGNNTQIDDCGNNYLANDGKPTTNPGSCYSASSEIIPSEGGTIMSYCHLNQVGMDFNLGFGTQPGNLVRSQVYNASCLGPCIDCVDEGNICDDGDPCTINDTYDVFCNCSGTPVIDPSDNGCNECTPTTISITFDQFGYETTWEIKNENGDQMISGNGTGSSLTTVEVLVCLSDGCYDFIINDSYGDGICCQYGSGSYTVSDNDGNVLASGGEFISTETTSFCYSNFTACADEDKDDICDDVDPCHDPMIMNIGEVLTAGNYNAREEIILNLGTVIPENAVIKLNAPIIKIMDNTNIPSSTIIETNKIPCSN